MKGRVERSASEVHPKASRLGSGQRISEQHRGRSVGNTKRCRQSRSQIANIARLRGFTFIRAAINIACPGIGDRWSTRRPAGVTWTRRLPSIRWMHGALDEDAITKAIDKASDRASIRKRSLGELGKRESVVHSELL